MKILLVGGGQKKYWPNITADYHYYVGIDRGSLYLQEAGLPLNLAIGDFDSLTSEEKVTVFNYANETITAPSEKDDTDTQLALSVILTRYPEAKIELIGVTGGRMDHFLANLWLVLEDYSTAVNNAGVWYDSVVAEVGLGSYDLDKPMVSGITYPMFRSQTQEDFNTSATTFTETAIDNINSMYQSIWFNWIRSYSADNYGSITDTNLTVQIDYGSVTDTNITI